MSTLFASGSRLTDPSLLGNLACDYDFSNPATLEQTIGGGGGNPSNGDPIGYALDQSGNGYHVQAVANGNRPTFQTNVNGSISASLFDGTDDYLERAVSNITANRGALSIYAVVMHAAAPTGREPYLMASTGDNLNVRVEHGAPITPANTLRTSVRRDNADTVAVVSSSANLGTSMRLATTVVNYTGNTIAVYFEGNLDGTGTPPGTAGANTQNTNGKLFVGGQGAVYMNGHIFRVMMFWDAHNAAQRSAVWNYLRNKYQF
jgi:hypothetical protein